MASLTTLGLFDRKLHDVAGSPYPGSSPFAKYINDNRLGMPSLFEERMLERNTNLSRTALGMQKGFKMGLEGGLLNLAFVGVQTVMAEKGEILTSTATGLVGIFSFAAFSSIITGGLMLIPGINVGVASFLAMGLAMVPEASFEEHLMKAGHFFKETEQRVGHLEMGGNYQDSELAQQQRMRAISEMSGSMQPSRRYLGQEARLMHR